MAPPDQPPDDAPGWDIPPVLPLPKHKGGRGNRNNDPYDIVAVKLRASVVAALKRRAAERNMPMSRMLRQIIEEQLLSEIWAKIAPPMTHPDIWPFDR